MAGGGKGRKGLRRREKKSFRSINATAATWTLPLKHQYGYGHICDYSTRTRHSEHLSPIYRFYDVDILND